MFAGKKEKIVSVRVKTTYGTSLNEKFKVLRAQ